MEFVRMVRLLSFFRLFLWWPYVLVVYSVALVWMFVRYRRSGTPAWLPVLFPHLAAFQLLTTLALFAIGYARDWISIITRGSEGMGVPSSIWAGAHSLPVALVTYVGLFLLHVWGVAHLPSRR